MNQLTIKDNDPNHVVFVFRGRLDHETVASLWPQCMASLEKHQPKLLTIHAEKLDYCDGSGIALFLALKHHQKSRKAQYHFEKLAPKFKNFMDLIVDSTHERILDHEHRHSTQHVITIGLGKIAAEVGRTFKNNLIFWGRLVVNLIKVFKLPRTLRWKDFWNVLEDTGPNALPIICLGGFLMGLISAFQAAIPLGEFGTQIYIANLVGISLVRELGALMTAILLAGRTASAFAAEIGTMKVNQEIDALTTMSLDSVQFLAIPRVIATTLMAPILSIFLIIFGLIGCGIVMNVLGFNLPIYLHQLRSAINLTDFIGGLIKAGVFGFLVASIGCLQGLKTETDASAVGHATTKAVVSSIIMIIIVDGIFACIYYALGI